MRMAMTHGDSWPVYAVACYGQADYFCQAYLIQASDSRNEVGNFFADSSENKKSGPDIG
ncbi:MAG: hypothetical protein K9K79_09475 [Desulfohalobiaceae bacterium]|nr:hypothetical protein [Desulfohalobiaceae bacterium]